MSCSSARKTPAPDLSALHRTPPWEWWSVAKLRQHLAGRHAAAELAYRQVCAIEKRGGQPVVFHRPGSGWQVLDESDARQFEAAFILKARALGATCWARNRDRQHRRQNENQRAASRLKIAGG